ncbi:GerAB/ArcD/ProY family transporter [Orenia marismortui]|uniref:GerAB/ArcD/ProY family transporter n=1 Tax=Orenia marismortui TaxID=46469 RepID=UPI001064D8A0|nr:GerAB/ArcD/ProY family transporter [Orenia marismortui]
MGLLIGAGILLISSLTDVLVLGVVRTARVYFPTYLAVARLNIGNFLQRLEITVSIVFLLSGFVKFIISYLQGYC